MRERLDRGLGSTSWIQMQENAAVQHLEYNHSDHRPLLLDTDFYAVPPSNPVEKPIRFEAKWLKEEGFSEVVEEAWSAAGSETNVIDVLQRLKTMHTGLHAWDQRVLRQPKKQLRNAQRDLDMVMRGPLSDDNEQKKLVLAQQIEKLLEQEEIKWNQRARANWLQNGDRNTAYFHSFASARKKRNFIKKLRDANGNMVEGTENLNPLVSDYFTTLFSSEINRIDPDFLEKITPKVSDDMNERLIAQFTAEDVRKAVFSIGDLKALGPDGLHALFYKKFWNLVGTDITSAVLQAINDRVIPSGWNETIVVLIPKVENPEEVTQFWPISLCNVVYKIISKMLAARLKVILPEIISPT
jgi:hypothetical protein